MADPTVKTKDSKPETVNSLAALVPTKKASSSKNGKNAAFYNNQRKEFIEDASVSDNVAVREFTAGNSHTPTSIIAAMLKTEKDVTVLRKLVLNPSVSNKALVEFCDDARAGAFVKDVEVTKHIEDRFK